MSLYIGDFIRFFASRNHSTKLRAYKTFLTSTLTSINTATFSAVANDSLNVAATVEGAEQEI